MPAFRFAMGMAILIVVQFAHAANPTFTRQEVMPGQAPWGKQLADLDGDGFADIVEGGGYINYARVYWFRYPTWERFQISADGGDDDLQVGDINDDGALDVVVNEQICWLENPRGSGGDVTAMWTKHIVDAGVDGHDLALGDLDLDGKLDIVSRGEGGAGPTYIYFQNTPDDWTRVQMTNVSTGEGTAIADIDRDGRPDLIGNGYWLKQPANPRAEVWPRYDVGAWEYIAGAGTADLNNDGRLDIILSPSETGPGTFAWFEAPPDPTVVPWTRHDIMPAEDIHRFHVADVNGDGRLDIFFGEMQQSATKRLGVLYNTDAGTSWTIDVIATTGAHNIAVGDVGNDGDLDILNANWNVGAPDGAPIDLWINDTNTTDTTPPTVSIVSPIDDAVLSGTVAVSAVATDNIAVAGVQFKLDGMALGEEIAIPPYAVAWDTSLTTVGTHSLVAVARDSADNIATSSLISVIVIDESIPDTTPPSVSITSPAQDEVVSGTVTLSAVAADDIAVAGVRFILDSEPFGDEVTAAPFELTWDSVAASIGDHSVMAIARDVSGNETSSTLVRFSVVETPDLIPPSVSILSPADAAIVSGTVTISAEASDDIELSCVQFQVDGVAISPEYEFAPFIYNWNTGNVPIGIHTIQAMACDTSGNVATSEPITVTVRHARINRARGWTWLR